MVFISASFPKSKSSSLLRLKCSREDSGLNFFYQSRGEKRDKRGPDLRISEQLRVAAAGLLQSSIPHFGAK